MMTKSKGIGRGVGGGRPAKKEKRIILSVALNADRVEAYKDYLSIHEGGRIITDEEVTEWVRSNLYAQVAKLDELADREAERTMVI